jgi:hypothetical protein
MVGGFTITQRWASKNHDDDYDDSSLVKLTRFAKGGPETGTRGSHGDPLPIN